MSDTSKHAHFYINTVTFRVEDSLFRIPREPFESESDVFRDMFLLPTGDLPTEGKSDENPIHLTGVTKDEFEQLLSVLFHRTHGKCQKSLPSTIGQWTSVLRLTGLWGFVSIHQVAMDRLQDELSAVDRIILGDDYDLDFESWSLPAMHEIVRRRQPISVEEVGRIGLEKALKLAAVREQISFRQRGFACEPVPGRRPDVETLDFRPILRTTFKKPSA